jgi:hypothetical protein
MRKIERKKDQRDTHTQKRDRPKNETSIILPFTDTVNKIFFQSRQIGNRTKVFLCDIFLGNQVHFISIFYFRSIVGNKSGWKKESFIIIYLMFPYGHFYLKKSFDSGPFCKTIETCPCIIGYHKERWTRIHCVFFSSPFQLKGTITYSNITWNNFSLRLRNGVGNSQKRARGA